jgi:hypothetical protein
MTLRSLTLHLGAFALGFVAVALLTPANIMLSYFGGFVVFVMVGVYTTRKPRRRRSSRDSLAFVRVRRG